MQGKIFVLREFNRKVRRLIIIKRIDVQLVIYNGKRGKRQSTRVVKSVDPVDMAAVRIASLNHVRDVPVAVDIREFGDWFCPFLQFRNEW